MAKTLNFSTLIAGLAVIIASGCHKNNPAPVAPTLATTGVSNISFNNANGGGVITNNGGATITASGLCWSSTNNSPSLSDSVVKGTAASGSFSSTMNNLQGNTNYYVRAYATNSAGTGYGNVVTFTTSVDTTKITFSYNGQTVTYGVIVSQVTGRKWMDRNLGASRAAIASNDSLAFGDLFQWGRLADGHQSRKSDTISVQSTTDVPGNSKFILVANFGPSFDWRNPSNDNLWQGSHGINNPCPAGWHVPQTPEWNAETGVVDSASAYAQLKLTVTSGQRLSTGSFSGVGTNGRYWTSTPQTSSGNAFYMSVNAATAGVKFGTQRGLGLAVRCIKD